MMKWGIFEKVLSTYKRTLCAVILSKPSRDSFDSQNAQDFLFTQNDTGGRAFTFPSADIKIRTLLTYGAMLSS